MSTPQGGIFALGTASHAYLELDARQRGATRELVSAVASLREPRTTMGGVNLVAGFRPELWREVVPDDAPSRIEGFNHDLVGADGYRMPATQHDAVLWLSGSAYDVVFDTARGAITALEAVASLAEETSSWPYQHDRDLTGFIDGSENPNLIDAADLAAISEGRPGAGLNPIQIGMLRWYNATMAGEFIVGDSPPGLAFDGQDIWLARSHSSQITRIRLRWCGPRNFRFGRQCVVRFDHFRRGVPVGGKRAGRCPQAAHT